MTQQEQIAQAVRAYVVPLNKTPTGATRFQVYLDYGDGEGLRLLYPSDIPQEGRKRPKDIMGNQVQYGGEAYSFPRYHWHLTGYGYSKFGHIRSELRSHNPNLKVVELNGYEAD